MAQPALKRSRVENLKTGKSGKNKEDTAVLEIANVHELYHPNSINQIAHAGNANNLM